MSCRVAPDVLGSTRGGRGAGWRWLWVGAERILTWSSVHERGRSRDRGAPWAGLPYSVPCCTAISEPKAEWLLRRAQCRSKRRRWLVPRCLQLWGSVPYPGSVAWLFWSWRRRMCTCVLLCCAYPCRSWLCRAKQITLPVGMRAWSRLWVMR